MKNPIVFSLVALFNGNTDAELDQLKAIDHDDVTRIDYDSRTMTLEVHTGDLPQKDGKLEIMKVACKVTDNEVNLGILEQDGIESNKMIATGFGKIFKALFTDPQTNKVRDGEFATAAIGSTKLDTRVRILSERDGQWQGWRPSAIRDFQPNFDKGIVALLGRDSSMAYAKIDDMFNMVEKGEDYKLFKDAWYKLKLTDEARLVRTIHGQDDIYAMVYDNKIQRAIGDNFQIVGFQPVFGPVMPVIDESQTGYVTTVTSEDGLEPNLNQYVEPNAAFYGEGNLAQRYALAS